MLIRRAAKADLKTAARLALALWPGYDPSEMAPLLDDPEAAIFLCEAEGRAVGFAQCQLRREYFEGCDTSPVCYLE